MTQLALFAAITALLLAGAGALSAARTPRVKSVRTLSDQIAAELVREEACRS